LKEERGWRKGGRKREGGRNDVCIEQNEACH
jgi:hypothetical protein